MVLIYWLNQKSEIYYRFYRIACNFEYKVGYENSYGHYIIAIFYINQGKFIQIEKRQSIYKKEISKKSKIIDNLIGFLEKLK